MECGEDCGDLSSCGPCAMIWVQSCNLGDCKIAEHDFLPGQCCHSSHSCHIGRYGMARSDELKHRKIKKVQNFMEDHPLGRRCYFGDVPSSGVQSNTDHSLPTTHSSATVCCYTIQGEMVRHPLPDLSLKQRKMDSFVLLRQQSTRCSL